MSSSEPCFLITVPKEMAASFRAKIHMQKEKTASTVGEIECNEPYVAMKSHVGSFSFDVKAQVNGTVQKFILKGEPTYRPERILAHERTTEDSYIARASEEKHMLSKKRKAEHISFKGVVTHSCKILSNVSSKESLMEMGRRLEAKKQKRTAQRAERKTKSFSVRDQPRPERHQGVVSLNPTSGMTATQVSRQEGMREQYEVKLSDQKMRKVLLALFRQMQESFLPDTKHAEFPGLKLKQGIMIAHQLKHQKEKWVKDVLLTIADYHPEAGLQYQRWTLQQRLQ